MNLTALQTEVFAHGFDPTLFGASRVTAYINNAYLEICRRVDYYVDEGSNAFVTVAGTQDYDLATVAPKWARLRSLRNTDTNVELVQVGLREIDRASGVSGRPYEYALNGPSFHLYPIPDGVYNLRVRYWTLPDQLVAGSDVPSIPPDYHQMLADWAIGRCYAAEDDPQTAQYWKGEFEKQLAMFMADVRFPSTDAPTQIKSMWGGDGQRGWSRV